MEALVADLKISSLVPETA